MTFLKNALEIERVPFSKLQKSEIPALAESVTRIVQKHAPDELLIEEVFNLLVAQKPRLDILNSRYGVHPLSLKLKPKREELMLYVSGIKHQLRKVTKTSTDATKDAVTIVKLAVDRNLLYLRNCKSQVEVLQKIQAFLTETETHADLSSALRSLGFMDEVENMELAHADVKSLLDRRRELTSLRPKGAVKVNSAPVFFALTAMFKEIEVAQLKNPSLDYVPLIDELNKLMKEYRNAINRRDAINKRKAMQLEGVKPEDATSETDASATETSTLEEQPSTDESDNSSVLPTTYVASIEKMGSPRIEEISSNGSSNGTGEINLEQLAQKKTVAVSAKQKQPSDKNGKA